MNALQFYWNETLMDISKAKYMRPYMGGDVRLAEFTAAHMLVALHKVNAAFSCVLRDHKDWKPQ